MLYSQKSSFYKQPQMGKTTEPFLDSQSVPMLRVQCNTYLLVVVQHDSMLLNSVNNGAREMV